MDEMMTTLQEADSHRIVVSSSEEARYRQLSGLAKRFGRIPEGMQITVTRSRDRQSTVTLRQRALRLSEALTTAARGEGMRVSAILNQAVNREYSYVGGARRDEIELKLESERFRLWFRQATLKVPHEATQREIARARRGYLFPDYDDVPAEHLGLVLQGAGGKFWADSWHDTDDHRLEEDLAQVLEEIRLRHLAVVARRKAEDERAILRRQREEEERTAAAEKFRREFVVDAMRDQAKRWEEATRLRNYAVAIRDAVEQLLGERREAALSWADRVEEQADRADPLPEAAKAPTIPNPLHADPSPFLKSWPL